MATAPNGWNEIVAYYSLPTRGPDGMTTQEWKSKNLVTVAIPFLLHLSWADVSVSHVTCHTKVVEPLLAALDAVLEADLASYLSQDYGGAYQDRAIRGASDRLSLHAFGAAIDFRVKENPLGNTAPEPQMIEVAKLFKALGWTWGGDFSGRKDNMHYQFASGY